MDVVIRAWDIDPPFKYTTIPTNSDSKQDPITLQQSLSLILYLFDALGSKTDKSKRKLIDNAWGTILQIKL